MHWPPAKMHQPPSPMTGHCGHGSRRPDRGRPCPHGGKDAPPIATPDAAKDALAADAAGLLDAIIIGDAGDAGAQDRKRSFFWMQDRMQYPGYVRVPDQAVLPPDAATVR